MFFQVPGTIPEIQPDTLFMIGNFPVTNALLMINLMTVVLVIFLIWFNRNLSIKPGKAQAVVEIFLEGILNLIDQITGKREVSEKIFPMIATLFIFVGVSNLIGLIPGFTSITVGDMPLFRTPTTDFNTTFALALAMMILVQLQSLIDWGIFGYIGRFIKVKEIITGFKEGFGAGAIAIIDFLIGLLDIISEIAKVVSLSVRLFGNIYAGEILMVIILGGLAYGLPAVWLGMNIFTGVIQALVFGALVAAYYGTAIKQESK
ncbi:MAG: F0F1 ATP synthase subunit A [Patescibacteria group bacterium]